MLVLKDDAIKHAKGTLILHVQTNDSLSLCPLTCLCPISAWIIKIQSWAIRSRVSQNMGRTGGFWEIPTSRRFFSKYKVAADYCNVPVNSLTSCQIYDPHCLCMHFHMSVLFSSLVIASLLSSGRFFNLLCMMEHIDVVLEWYRRLVPSVSTTLCLCAVALWTMKCLFVKNQ